MRSHQITVINKAISKLTSLSNHYKLRSTQDSFVRDGEVYQNTEDWKDYWISISEHWEKVIETYYELLKIVHKNKMYDSNYPLPPSQKFKVK